MIISKPKTQSDPKRSPSKIGVASHKAGVAEAKVDLAEAKVGGAAAPWLGFGAKDMLA